MKLALVAAIVLAGCGGNPFTIDRDDDGDGPEGVDGTPNATARGNITRVEERSEANGNGYAEGFVYDQAADTFSVDGLAFDGDNVYARDDVVASLGPYEVYEADATAPDSVTGALINQFVYRAVQGRSTSLVNGQPATRFAIVRTGSYTGYGFGGFVYERSGPVTLPASGDAYFTGRYAGLRDFNGVSGLQYAEADMEATIDFDDFNDSDGLVGDGIRGRIYNRVIRDLAGNDVTSDFLTALNADIAEVNPAAANLTSLPVITFKVGPGLISRNGEVAGDADSRYFDGNEVRDLEVGKYYAIISDTSTINAGEFVGVVVVEGDVPGTNGSASFRETGGFILYRP
ncbi:MAG: hypothetical protein RLZZ437_1595 [Pseudomonadota bacterium]